MFFTDDFYGHRRILADHVGLATPRPILAHLQHGWNPNEGFGRRYLRGETKPTRLPTIVWSAHNLAVSLDLDLPNVEAIGAPYGYLHAMLAADPTSPPADHGTGAIVYPLHMGHGVAAERAGEDRFIAEVVEREGPGTTMCLYWREFDDPAIRGAYEDAGFRVITHGRREDPVFLVRQREELLAHRRVISNRVSTALFYAGLVGRELEVYGPVFGSGDAEEAAWWTEVQARRWPELLHGPLASADAFVLSGTELGYELRREPAELAELLGWTSARRVAGPVVEAVAKARRRATGGGR